jgi:hypothetical protein
MTVMAVLVPGPLFAADVSDADKGAAQALFDEGRRLVEKGQYAEACPKFARSEELDPGGGTLLNLAACHEKLGRAATAWAEFNDALSSAIRDGRADRQRYARKHIEALRAKLAQVVVSVVQPAPGQQVRIDDVPLAQGAWGLSTPIDPGTHIIDSTAPERHASRKTITVAERDQLTVEIGPLAAAEPVAPPARAEGQDSLRPAERAVEPGAEAQRPVLPQPASPVGPPPARDSAGSSGSTRTLGFVLGGAGIAALGVGTYFGLRAISSWNDSNKGCPANVCTPQAASDARDAKTSAVVSDVAVVTGLLAVGTGTVLVLSSGARSRHDPQAAAVTVRFSLASVAIDGAW